MTPNDPATTDPNGQNSATRIAATQPHSDVYQSVSSQNVTSGESYTFSVWLKAPTSTPAVLAIDRPGGDWEQSAVTVGTTWQRYTFTHDGTWTGSGHPR